MYYAVKKIRLEREDWNLNRKILREVTTISRLYHPNIVRYYQAWVEGDGVEEESEDDLARSDDESEYLLDDGFVWEHEDWLDPR